MQGIADNLGISIFSKNAIKNHEKFGLVKSTTFKDLTLKRQLYFVYKSKHTFLEDEARFMKEFIKHVQKEE